MNPARLLAAAAISMAAACAPARDSVHDDAQRAARMRAVMQRLRAESRFPGAVAGAWLASDSSTITVAVGDADRDRHTPMPPDAFLHAGSVGKTLFAALALQLVGDGRVHLDDRVSSYLGAQPWYARVPNADSITIRMLLNHSSGIPEYGADFMRALIADPGRRRAPLDAVRSVLGAEPVAAAGERFAYSDVNYQLLQLLMEQVTGAPAYDEIQRRFLRPLALDGIVPADTSRIPGLVQGYAGADNFLGFDASIRDGALILDPAFEGGGGGFVTRAGDLARWTALFGAGKVFPESLLADVRRGVPAGQMDVGANARSGLGVEMAETPIGTAYGHGGFFPGYLSLALWYPDRGVAVAVQVNSSAPNALGRPLRDVLLEIARALTEK